MNKNLPTLSTTISFQWRADVNNPACLAIMYAIHAGYNIKYTLIKVLPQFSLNRLENALSTLIANGLVEILNNQLILATDAMLIDQLVQQPITLPIEVPINDKGFLDDNAMIAILGNLGINNVGLALSVLKGKQ